MDKDIGESRCTPSFMIPVCLTVGSRASVLVWIFSLLRLFEKMCRCYFLDTKKHRLAAANIFISSLKGVKKMSKKLVLKIAVMVCFVLMVAVNILANTLPIGDFNTGQISAMYPTLITPPGWTFSIWGVIYALLFIYAVRQFFKETPDTAPYFILSCVLNIAWIFAWHMQYMLLAAVMIILLAVVLFKLYMLTRKADFLTKAAFSIYYAWITAAAVIMIFAAIKTLTGHAPITPIVPRSSAAPSETGGLLQFFEEFTGIILISGTPEIVSYVTLGEYIMAIIFLVLICFIAVMHMRDNHDVFYLAVILWALAGIFIRQLSSVTPPYILLTVCAVSMAVILLQTGLMSRHRQNT